MAQSSDIEAFLYDISTDADFSILRDGEPLPLAPEAVDRLAMPLQEDDLVVLRAGQLKILARYSGTKTVLGPLAVTQEPRSFVIASDEVPSAMSKVRDALTALVDMLRPSLPDPTEVRLITKGGKALVRDEIFPPSLTVADASEKLVVSYTADMSAPVLELTWGKAGHFATPVLIDEGKRAFTVPFTFGQLLRGDGGPVEWHLSDETGEISIRGSVTIAPAEAGLSSADPVLDIAHAWSQGRVFEARSRAASLSPDTDALLWQRLARRLALEGFPSTLQ